jgi:acetylornithine deacetylase/succinyl-diaminopimelate desuccinylase family protein
MDKLLTFIDDAYGTQLLKDMVKIPSVVGDEKGLAEFLEQELKALGFDTRLQWVQDGRPNVIGVHRFGEGKLFMFNGHLDTVPVCEGWTTDPFNPVEKEGKLYGLGASDMKGGIACMLTALKAIRDADAQLKGTLAFSGVVGEEGYSEGARGLLKTELAKADAALIGEPFNDNILGITGKVLYELIVKGKSAHGFQPEEGVNAVEEAAKIITALDKLELRTHPRFGKGNTCTIKIEGGYERYSVMVPDRCRVEVNRLIVPGESVDSTIDDLKRLVNSLGLKGAVEVRTKPPYYEPFEMSSDEALVRTFVDAFKAVRGFTPKTVYTAGISDANVFVAEGGIPTVQHGPAGGGIHQANELVYLNDVKSAAMVDALTAAKFLS